MKKIYNILMMLALAVAGVSLTACSEDVVDTNQFMGDVSLSAYGPQPVVRGGYLRFIGSNLDQIREIQIPGVDPITNIEVIKAGIPSEIRIVVPKDGPETGIVKLISKSGKEILTKTALSYDEPITIDTILIKGKEVMPGETIKIQGDYLNLIHMVEFADGVWVSEDDFVSHDRYTIEVVVPEKARTGKLKLYTADLTKAEDPDALTYNIVPSNSALVVGTPVVAKFSSPRGEAEALGDVTIKQGETLTISGNFFTLVDSVKFGKDVYVKDLIFADDGGKTLKLVLPAAAPDGDVNLVAKSGVEIPVGTITTVAPSNCAAAPSPVKAGQPLTVTGNDLDVVVSITMNGAADPVEFSYADGKITINAVPETAVEGNLNLIMLNGKSTEVAFTLVKPAVTSYDNNPANAGGALTITGTNLDLVKSVAFGNGVYTVSEGDCSADGTTLKLTVPMDAQSGKPMLKLANGTEVEA
ncbi:MAG: polygalacturonase, partial [Bacteroidaceae bacterium]|nr:polygalacturonase [Bacteroidaceae bacterium]